MTTFAKFRWKYLLGVFKLRRLVNLWHGSRLLDYEPIPLRIMTSTIREHETRARSVHKEPETVSWIETMNTESDVLYDVGANIGAYTLIAAARGIPVVAFEPAPQNFAALQENVTLNALDDRVLALPLVLGNGEGRVEFFNIHEYARGATEGFFTGQTVIGVKKQFPVMSLDACIAAFHLQQPTALKLDVDGGELEVLGGALRTLSGTHLRTVLVETEDKNSGELEAVLKRHGFSLLSSYPRSGGASNLIFRKLSGTPRSV